MYGNRRTSASALPALPPGAQQPAVAPNNHASPAYTFQVTAPVYQDDDRLQSPWPSNLPSQNFARPRVQSMHEPNSLRPSALDVQRPRMPFPEPEYYRQPFQQPVRPIHHYSRSDFGTSNSNLTAGTPYGHHNPSVASLASSYISDDNNYYGSGSNEVCLYPPAVYIYIEVDINRHTMTKLEI